MSITHLEKLSLKAMKKFVHPRLYKLVGWLKCEKLFKDAADIGDSEMMKRVLQLHVI